MSKSSIESNVFAERLCGLMEEIRSDTGTRTTQRLLAEKLGCKYQTVASYMSGESSPDWRKLRLIAEEFQVSVDYLVGLTDVRSPESDIRNICEQWGLTDEAAENVKTHSALLSFLASYPFIKINKQYKNSNILEILDDFITQNNTTATIAVSNTGEIRSYPADNTEDVMTWQLESRAGNPDSKINYYNISDLTNQFMLSKISSVLKILQKEFRNLTK